MLIVDTAGRLAIDEAMMAEIKALHAAINPVETLFVVDAMTGQDAANTAKAFSEALAADRRGADQDRRRRPRRRRAVGALHHRPADQVHRRRREARRPGCVPSRPRRQPHPRHGRRAVAWSSRCESAGRPGQGRTSWPRRSPRARSSTSTTCATSSQQMQNMGGLSRPDGQAAGHGPDPGPCEEPGHRQGSAAHDRHHQFDDQEGAPQPGPAERLAPRPHRHAAPAPPRPTSTSCSSSTSRWKR